MANEFRIKKGLVVDDGSVIFKPLTSGYLQVDGNGLVTAAALPSYQPLDADLTAIAALAGTTGLLRKTAADTWSLDTASYLTSVPTFQQVLTADSTLTGTNTVTIGTGAFILSGTGTSNTNATFRITAAGTNGLAMSITSGGRGLLVTPALDYNGITSDATGLGNAYVGSSIDSPTAYFNRNPTSTNTAVSILQLSRFTSGTAADNIGASIDIYVETSSGSGNMATQLISRWSTANDATKVSQFEIWGVNNNGSIAQLFTVKGAGQIRFNKYGINTFSGTAAYTLGVDTSGNIVEFTPSGYTLPIASAGTLGGIKVGSGLAIDGSGVLSVSGSGGLTAAYTAFTDGTNSTTTSAATTFKLRSADNKLSITVTDNDATHGDNALFSVNEANLTIAQSQVTNLVTDLGNKQPLDADLTAIASLAGTTGFLKKTAADTWSLDTNTYLTSNQTITLSGDVSGSGTTAITTAIGANKVTLAMMATVASSTFLGRVTASTGNVEALTGTQATTLLDVFTTSLKGLAPASGGGTTNFLRADGTWAAPPGGGDTLTRISFKVGESTYPGDTDDTYTNTNLIGKTILVYREGWRVFQGDTSNGIAFNDTTGVITFYPSLTLNEQIIIEYVGSVGTTYTFSQSLSNSGGTVTLLNDSATPGNNMVYGTNGSGTKGWYAGGGGSGDVTTNTNQTITGVKTFNSSVSGDATKGFIANPVSTATANNDVLTGVYLNPTFSIGAFTGVVRRALHVESAGAVVIGNNTTNNYTVFNANINGDGTTTGAYESHIDVTNGWRGQYWRNDFENRYTLEYTSGNISMYSLCDVDTTMGRWYSTAQAGANSTAGTKFTQIGQYSDTSSLEILLEAKTYTTSTNFNGMKSVYSATTYIIQGASAATSYTTRFSITNAGEITISAYPNTRADGATSKALYVDGSGALKHGVITVDVAVTVTDGTTPAIDASLGNIFTLVAAADRTLGVPTNAVDGKKITIRFEASGADRTLTLPTGSAGSFRFGTDITALSLTPSGKTDYIGCVYRSSAQRWDVVAYTKGF